MVLFRHKFLSSNFPRGMVISFSPEKRNVHIMLCFQHMPDQTYHIQYLLCKDMVGATLQKMFSFILVGGKFHSSGLFDWLSMLFFIPLNQILLVDLQSTSRECENLFWVHARECILPVGWCCQFTISFSSFEGKNKKFLAMLFYKVTAELTLLGSSNTSQVFKWFWIKPNTLIR